MTITTRRPATVVGTALAATALLGGAAYATTTTGTASTAGTVTGGTTSVAAPARAAAVPSVHTWLRTSSPALDACYPNARAKVTVDLTTEDVGKDRFTIEASGLRPRTTFTVFLLEQSGAPFGAAEYIGDFRTDAWGRAENTYRLIVEEAFAFDNQSGSRTDLDAVGFWFANPRADDGCLGAGSPVTGFDGDASAGVQMMNSGTHLLP